jgi:hypothetical protein
MLLGDPISATLCRRAVLILWHAFLFLGLGLFSSFCSVASTSFSHMVVVSTDFLVRIFGEYSREQYYR